MTVLQTFYIQTWLTPTGIVHVAAHQKPIPPQHPDATLYMVKALTPSDARQKALDIEADKEIKAWREKGNEDV